MHAGELNEAMPGNPSLLASSIEQVIILDELVVKNNAPSSIIFLTMMAALPAS